MNRAERKALIERLEKKAEHDRESGWDGDAYDNEQAAAELERLAAALERHGMTFYFHGGSDKRLLCLSVHDENANKELKARIAHANKVLEGEE